MKYFLALFLIFSSSALFCMDGTEQQLDKVTEHVLRHYFKIEKLGLLNNDGIEITVHKNSSYIELCVIPDNDAETELARMLRETASPKSSPNASSRKTPLVECRARSWEVVHKSSSNYKNSFPEEKMHAFDVKAVFKFTREDFDRYRKQFSY